MRLTIVAALFLGPAASWAETVATQVEVLAGAEPSVAWRGLADGVVTIKKPDKRGKRVAPIIRKLFESFPDVE